MDAWDAARVSIGQSTSAGEGVAIQDGNGGSEVAPRSEALAGLGFVVAGFCDNDDRSVDAALGAAKRAGVVVIRWSLDHNTETQVCSELEVDGLTSIVELGVKMRTSEDTVLQDLNAVDQASTFTSLDVASWLTVASLAEIRVRVAKAAIERRWFKDVQGGRDLGEWIIDRFDDPQLATTSATLVQFRDFIYPDVALGARRTSRDDAAKGETWSGDTAIPEAVAPEPDSSDETAHG
jgi:hypothetical protein